MQPTKTTVPSQLANAGTTTQKPSAASFGTPNSSLALVEGPAGMNPRTHNGLPIIMASEYRALYHSQSDERTIRTFNFQGYVEMEGGSLVYKDVLATNGLRGGIHVGIDGVTDYWDHSGRQMQGPEDVGEYNVYIQIPSRIQKECGVVVACDSCQSAERYASDWSEERIARAQDREDYVVVRLSFKVQGDDSARQKVMLLAQAINDFIRAEKPLEHLTTFIRGVEDILDDPVASRARWGELRKKLGPQ